MDNLRRILTLLLFIILFSQTTLAIKVSPPIDAGELESGEYEFFISIRNQDNTNNTITLYLTPRAKYLSNYVTLEPNSFELGAYETKEVKVTLLNSISEVGPGIHILTILPEVSAVGGSGVKITSTSVAEIKFSIPGEVIKKLELEDFKVIQEENNINFQLLTKNIGNVRVGAFPFVEIQKYYGSSPVYHSSVKGRTQYLISPGSLTQMDIRYNTASLETGRYNAIAKVEYDNNETSTISKTFEIKKSEEEQAEIESNISVREEENYTINISGKVQDTQDEVVQDTQHEVEKAELRVSSLKVEQAESGDLVINLGIENIFKDNISYEIIFNIFDEFGNKVDEIEDSGEIEGRGTKEIKKSWYGGKSGDHKVRVELKYGDKKEEKECWSKPLQKQLSEKPENVPTGFLIFNPISENSWIILIIVVIGLIFIYFRTSKKKDKSIYFKKKSFEYIPKKKNNKPVYLKRKYSKRK